MMQKTLLAILLTLTLIGGYMKTNEMINNIPSTGPSMTATLNGTNTSTTLKDFVQSVSNGQRDEVTGIFVPGVLAMPVGQQPKGNAGYVTREPEKVTQFGMAAQYGTVGILAHNDLAGAEFSDVKKSQYAIVVYGDGQLDYYVINEIQKYQALSPASTFSDFVNLDNNRETLSASEVFSRIYGPGDRLVFQTCIAANGDPSWGRMFIIAKPANQEVFSILKQTSFVFNFANFGMAAH